MTDQNKILNIGDSMTYQSEAIVSKTVLKTGSGSVTLFAFAEGESLTEHTTAQNALAVIMEGTAEISISGEVHTVTGGELILLPAGEPHALKAVSAFKMLLVMIQD